MVRYAKCPRCELNYIDIEKQQFCEICVKEMKGVEDDMFFSEEDEDELKELCPQCGENMMRAGETMCEQCKKRLEYADEEDIGTDIDTDEKWRDYLDDEPEETDDLGLKEEFGAEFDEDEEDEEDEMYEGEDEDLEYVTGEDIDKYAAGDDDDDEEDEDDEDFEMLEKKARNRRAKNEDDDF